MVKVNAYETVFKIQLVIYLLAGSFAFKELKTKFSSEIVLEGSSVELTIVMTSAENFSSIACGIYYSGNNYGYVTLLDPSKKKLKLNSITNEYKNRVFVRNDWTTVISNISIDDEGRSFYCNYMVKGDTTQRDGEKHTIKSVQVIAKIFDEQIASVTPAKEKTKLVLQCLISGYPLQEPDWNGPLAALGITETTYFRKSKGYHVLNISLHITEVKPSYHGLSGYCSAWNHFGSVVQKTTLDVAYTPKNTSFNITHRWISANAEVTMKCKASSNPNSITYSFFRDKELLKNTTSSIYRFTTSVCTSSIYKCVPINKLGSGVTASQEVTIAKPPLIKPLPNKIIARVGDGLHLFCNATGCPKPTVVWHRNDDDSFGSKPNIHIKQVLRTHEGIYKCMAPNFYGKVSTTVLVEVQYPPEDLTIASNMPENIVTEGQPLVIKCNSDASPKPKYHFYLGNATLNSSMDGILQIDKATCGKHNGLFSCKAVNKLGKASVQMKISCRGKAIAKKRDSMSKKSIVIFATISFAAVVAISCVSVYMFKRWNKNRQISPSRGNTSTSTVKKEQLLLQQRQGPMNEA